MASKAELGKGKREGDHRRPSLRCSANTGMPETLGSNHGVRPPLSQSKRGELESENSGHLSKPALPCSGRVAFPEC